MKITEYIGTSIDRLPKGYVFTYADFIDKVKGKEAIIKALNRMAASGKIEKLAKGKYYKPEKSSFGNLKPNPYQLVKDLLEDNGKIIGYLTGYGIYNQLGLTTQISNIIQIGKNNVRPSFKRTGYKISFIQQKNNITKENIPLLQILDSIRYIKKIPDTTISFVCVRLLKIIKDLPVKDQSTLVKLSLKYSPSVRALLGALLEEIGKASLLNTLYNSLNPITTYNISGVNSVLSKSGKWNIK